MMLLVRLASTCLFLCVAASPAALVDVQIDSFIHRSEIAGQYLLNSPPIGPLWLPFFTQDETSDLEVPDGPATNLIDGVAAPTATHTPSALANSTLYIQTLPRTLDVDVYQSATGYASDGAKSSSALNNADMEFSFDIVGDPMYLDISSYYAGPLAFQIAFVHLIQDGNFLTLPTTPVGVANMPQLDDYLLAPASYVLRVHLSLESRSNFGAPAQTAGISVSVVPEASSLLLASLGVASGCWIARRRRKVGRP